MLRKVKLDQLTKRTRPTPSSFESLPKWPELKAILDKGLGEAEAWELDVTDEQAVKFDLTHRRTGTRFLQKYVRELGKRYSVKSVRTSGGTVYQVSNPVVVVAKRRKRA